MRIGQAATPPRGISAVEASSQPKDKDRGCLLQHRKRSQAEYGYVIRPELFQKLPEVVGIQ